MERKDDWFRGAPGRRVPGRRFSRYFCGLVILDRDEKGQDLFLRTGTRQGPVSAL
jgi:hypothetical protein